MCISQLDITPDALFIHLNVLDIQIGLLCFHGTTFV